MWKRLWRIIAALIVAECTGCAVDVRVQGRGQAPDTLVLTIEGCHVYRFTDKGAYNYVTICPHADTKTWYDDRHVGATGNPMGARVDIPAIHR